MMAAILAAAAMGASPTPKKSAPAPQPEAPDTLMGEVRVTAYQLNGWSYLDSAEGVILFYMAPIQRQGGLPRITTRWEFARKSPQAVKGYLSVRQVQEMDCIRGLAHTVERTAHKAGALEGPVVPEAAPTADAPPAGDAAWLPPAPGTLEEVVFRKACAPL